MSLRVISQIVSVTVAKRSIHQTTRNITNCRFGFVRTISGRRLASETLAPQSSLARQLRQPYILSYPEC